MPTFYVKDLGGELRKLFLEFLANDRRDFLKVLEKNELRHVRIPQKKGFRLAIEYHDCTKEFAIELLGEIIRRYKKYLYEEEKGEFMALLTSNDRVKRAEWLDSVYKTLESQGKTKKQLAEAIGVSAPHVYSFHKHFPAECRRIAICEFLNMPSPPEFKNYSPNGAFAGKKNISTGGRSIGSKNKPKQN